MNPVVASTPPLPDVYNPLATDLRSTRSVAWSAIFAGWVASLALQILFVLLGAGLGFALYSPLTDDNPVTELGTGAVVIHGISAVLSLWLGGWVAGRLAPTTLRKTGWLHGFTVWAVAMVMGVVVVAGGAGWVMGDLTKLVSGGLSLAGQSAGAAAGGAVDLAKEATRQTTDTLNSFTSESVARLPENRAPGADVRARREIGFAVARLFSPAEHASTPENRAALVRTLASQTGLSEGEADRMVTEWQTSYDRLKSELAAAKEEATAKAKIAADKAAQALTIFSLAAFVAFVLGAVAASFGGRTGAAAALRADLRDRAGGVDLEGVSPRRIAP